MLYKEAVVLIDYIKKTNYKLNDWEVNFIESIELRNPDTPLTLKQSDCILRIYEKSHSYFK